MLVPKTMAQVVLGTESDWDEYNDAVALLQSLADKACAGRIVGVVPIFDTPGGARAWDDYWRAGPNHKTIGLRPEEIDSNPLDPESGMADAGDIDGSGSGKKGM